MASSSESGGKTVASRRASMVLPAPGGPSMMTLWPPAAAISSARLAEIGGGEIDGDPLSGELEAGVPEGRTDAIAALAHGGIGQAHRGEARQPRGDIHLHRHRGGFDALERGREDPRQHGGESED